MYRDRGCSRSWGHNGPLWTHDEKARWWEPHLSWEPMAHETEVWGDVARREILVKKVPSI